MDDDQVAHAPDSRDGVATRTLGDILPVLEEHARQIETLAAANKQLEGRNTALEERCKALDRKSESLERSCDKLEVRCSSLERSIQVLKKGINWRHSAPEIPHSHWIEQGHDEEYADDMDEMISYIKHDTKRIRSGEVVCQCLDRENQFSVLHDDALLPHFQELADAIQVSSGIQSIIIDNIEMRPSALSILFPVMEGKVTEIFMQSVTFPEPDVVECNEIVATSIRLNHALEKLTWIGDDLIPSGVQADLLIESVIKNQAIKTAVLDSCFGQNGANGCRALATLIKCGRHLMRIEFCENGLSGIDDVAAALATNPQLEKLCITENQLDDSDAELIAHALKQNTNLQALSLDGNNITSTGLEKMIEAIYDPSSLSAMESCNHTCWIDCFVPCEGGNYIGIAPQQRRRLKLYKMLSVRHEGGSNARHLNAELGEGAFSTKLVPRVLECIEQYSTDHRFGATAPLSLYFELMKSWKMPELYERGIFEGK